MNLKDYKDFIKVLPFKDQSFETKKVIWNVFRGYNPSFDDFLDEFFANRLAVEFSRGDIFSLTERNKNAAIFATLLWGYPSGYTQGHTIGRMFPMFLDSFETIKRELEVSKTLSSIEFQRLIEIKGMGLSTITKFLYFFRMKVDNVDCLILDSRIIKVLQDKKFVELDSLHKITEGRKWNMYLDYLRLMNELAISHGYKAEQLEWFLFLMGKNLKSTPLADVAQTKNLQVL